MRRARLAAGACAIGASLLTPAARAELGPYFGARASSAAFRFDGDDGTSLSGAGVTIDGGVRVASSYRLYASWDHGVYDARSDRSAPGPLAKGDGLGVGLRIDGATDASIGVAIELGVGVRRLVVPYARSDGGCGQDTFHGVEPLRLRVGPSFALGDGLRLDVLFGGAVGAFRGPRGHGETCTIVASCQDSLYDSAADAQTNAYLLLDVSLSVHLGY